MDQYHAFANLGRVLLPELDILLLGEQVETWTKTGWPLAPGKAHQKQNENGRSFALFHCLTPAGRGLPLPPPTK